MRINLENIGKVGYADVEIKGLTVITGGNNSGKTTVGKVLFSLLNVISEYDRKAEIDKKIGMDIVLRDIVHSLDDIQRIFYRTSSGRKANLFDEQIKSIYVFVRKPLSEKNYNEFKQLLLCVKEEINKLFSEFDNGDKESENALLAKQLLTERSTFIFEKIKGILHRLDHFDVSDFVLDKIQRSLNDEFSKQIIPVKYPNAEGKIQIQFDEYKSISLDVNENQIKFAQTTEGLFSPYRRVFFIDNPYLVDDLSVRTWSRGWYESEPGDIICNHNEHLLRHLRAHRENNYFATWLNTQEGKDIYNFIKNVVPGNRVDKSDGVYYFEKGSSELKVSNLATGSKMFFLLKNLFENGYLDHETVLILDEPEAHLHPEWQNIFAEFIVRLVKLVGVKVLLTTHSPNFMLALEAMALEYGLGKSIQTYKTEMCSDGYQTTYRKVSDDLDIVYSDFIRAMVKMQTMKKRLLEGIDEDDK